jgi:hypothetical protein
MNVRCLKYQAYPFFYPFFLLPSLFTRLFFIIANGYVWYGSGTFLCVTEVSKMGKEVLIRERLD